jgi:hypothetical protein
MSAAQHAIDMNKLNAYLVQFVNDLDYWIKIPALSSVKDFPGKEYDFVALSDCTYDMGEPAGTAAHVRQSVSRDRVWLIIEPFAND